MNVLAVSREKEVKKKRERERETEEKLGGGGCSIPHHIDFHPSSGRWEMSGSNWVDKAVLSFRRKYSFDHKRPPRHQLPPSNPPRSRHRRKRAPRCVFTYAGRSESSSSLQVKAGDTMLRDWIWILFFFFVNFCPLWWRKVITCDGEMKAEVTSIRGAEGE